MLESFNSLVNNLNDRCAQSSLFIALESIVILPIFICSLKQHELRKSHLTLIIENPFRSKNDNMEILRFVNSSTLMTMTDILHGGCNVT